MSRIHVRAARADDLAAVNAIYNHYVVSSHCTFDVEPTTPEQRSEWFGHYGEAGPHRVVVALDGDSVVGFASSGPYRPRPAYATSVEVSVYVAHDAREKGTGTLLYEELFARISGEDVHRAYAGIALPNEPSIALHERLGFRKVAHFSEQGRKFGRYWDVAWYEDALIRRRRGGQARAVRPTSAQARAP